MLYIHIFTPPCGAKNVTIKTGHSMLYIHIFTPPCGAKNVTIKTGHSMLYIHIFTPPCGATQAMTRYIHIFTPTVSRLLITFLFGCSKFIQVDSFPTTS